jgi:hypothetical protein
VISTIVALGLANSVIYILNLHIFIPFKWSSAICATNLVLHSSRSIARANSFLMLEER